MTKEITKKEEMKQPRKTKTVTIERTNKEGKVVARIIYAKVTDRVAELHKEQENASITTDSEFRDGYVLFRAKVTPDVKNPERYFTGTSVGKIGAEKALEKLETLAVGRALAFAGYLATGEIASAEEMEKYESDKVIVDVSEAMAKMQAANSLVELAKVYRSLSADERNNTEVNALKDELKLGFGGVVEPITKIPDETI